MMTWKISRLGILSGLVAMLLIGEVQAFPSLGRPDSGALPAEIETQDGRSVNQRPSIVSAVDDSAVLKASDQPPIRIGQGEEPLPQPLKLDYYDYFQLPNDPDDELPALPDHAVNVNEDYAGIYDYRGSQDGRFRRKRTLTTNVEQFLTRSSRTHSKRSPTRYALNENTAAVSPAEQAENLVSLLNVMQDSDPEFDAAEFLKVLEAPSVGERDLEYLLLLSNLASQREAAIPDKFLALTAMYRNPHLGQARSHLRASERKQSDLSPDVLLDANLGDQGSWFEDTEQTRTIQRSDMPRPYPIDSLLSAREPSAGIAM